MPARQDIRLGGQSLEKRMAATDQGRMPQQFAVAGTRRQQGPFAQTLVVTFHLEPPSLRAQGVVAVEIQEIHGCEVDRTDSRHGKSAGSSHPKAPATGERGYRQARDRTSSARHRLPGGPGHDERHWRGGLLQAVCSVGQPTMPTPTKAHLTGCRSTTGRRAVVKRTPGPGEHLGAAWAIDRERIRALRPPSRGVRGWKGPGLSEPARVRPLTPTIGQ